MKFEIIFRSLESAGKFGRFEGYCPIKHVGVKVTDKDTITVFHVKKQKPSSWFSSIEILEDNEIRFSSGLGIKSIAPKEVSPDVGLKSIEKLKSMDGKKYIPIIRDCDLVASVCYEGKKWPLLHRQFWVVISLFLLLYGAVHGHWLANHKWDQSHYLLNWFSVVFSRLTAALMIFYYFFIFNNTTAQQPNEPDEK